MEIKTNEKVYFVEGACRGAFYDFNSGKVYSVNNAGVSIIKAYCKGENAGNERYLETLMEAGLIFDGFAPQITDKTFFEKPEPKVEVAWLEITEGCNLRCIHCYEGDVHTKFRESLSLPQWKGVIDQLVDLGVQRIIIIGGEPCCSREVESITEYCGEKHVQTTFFTNATMLSERLLNIIKKCDIRVKISIYGGDAKTHDEITAVPGSFERMNASVDKMSRLGIKMSASVILMKENQNQLSGIIDFLKKKGIKYSGYDVIRNVFGGTQSAHTPVESEEVAEKYISKPSFVADEKRFIYNHYVNSCWFGKIAIQEDGNVIPCVFQRDISFGNVKEKSIKTILLGNKTADCWYYDFSKVSQCSCCEYRYACKDCRAMGISVCGKMDSKNPRCLYNPTNGIWASKKEF